MRTVKLVIAGDSGVGKTSIRGQYISGRFSTGYRATIGADFIAKTLPHHAREDESVTLQIWDTAGQERFSSLSTAFFRGADAALLVYDVTNPKSLEGIRKWWHEFQERAPVPDEYAEEYCCVVVGNKTDLVKPGEEPAVTEADARRFLEELIPRTGDEEEDAEAQEVDLPALSRPASPTTIRYRDDATDTHTERQPSDDEDEAAEAEFQESLYQLPPEELATSPRSPSIAINRSSNYTPPGGHPHFRSQRSSKSRSRSRISQWGGTMTSVNSGLSMYHTPSSSVFDDSDYASAHDFHSLSSSPAPPTVTAGSPLRSPRRVGSTSTTSSQPTITPSLFTHRDGGLSSTDNTPPSLTVPDPQEARLKRPPKPERRPRLFFTSAKSGQSVQEVFEYVARRVTVQREYEESVEARVLHMRESSRDTVYLSDHQGRSASKSGWGLGGLGSCCST